MEDEDKSRIDDLEKNLYSRKKEQIEGRERREFHTRDYGVSDAWENVEEPMSVKSRRPIIKMILVASVTFFVVSVVFSGFFFFKGVDISPSNVVIHIEGPALIGGGEELGLQISIKNNNPVPIEATNLSIKYPDGTYSSANIDNELPRYSESVGTLKPGEEVRRTVKAVLFGEEGSKKVINIRVDYQVRGSGSTEFKSEATYELALSSSPLSLTIESLEEAISGQEVEFTATVKSNSSSIVKGAMLTVEYPFGFEFGEATPSPFFANKTWNLGDIPPEGEVKITFNGILSGQDGEDRVFRFITGLQSENDTNRIGAKFINISETLSIKRPFITTNLTIGEKSENFVVESGDVFTVNIEWVNNLATQIFDGEINVKISGDSINRSTIDSSNGFFRSIDNTMIWTRETQPDLGTIASGDSGSVNFDIGTFGIDSGNQTKNSTINLDVTVRGKRISEGSVPEQVVSTISREVKITSDLAVTSKVLRNTGPFVNTGPIPPVAEKETTYTILLSVFNSSNEVSNGQVIMTLPPYVTWLGNISPLTEEVTYSSVGGRIIWNLDTIKPGTGTVLPLREMAFQVKVLPSISQIGKEPVIVNEQTITGFDRFTEVHLESTRAPLTTLISEPGLDGSRSSQVVAQ